MKNNKSIYGILLVALSLAGCTKDGAMVSPEPTEKTGTVVLSLGAPATRTSLSDDTKIGWSAGDRINVNGENYTVVIDAQSGAATIEVIKADSYTAVYPGGNFDAQTSTLTLPQSQSYLAGSFGNGANPMVAYSTGTSLNFRSICGVVKLSLTGDNIPLSEIELSDNAGGKVSGAFILSGIETGAPTLTGGENESVKLALSQNPVLDPDTPTDFYLVVPANESNELYRNGFTVKILTDDGDIIEKSSADNTTVKASDVVRMPAFEIVPVAQTVYFQADDSADWSEELPAAVTTRLAVKTAEGSVLKKSLLASIETLLNAAEAPIDLDLGEATYFSQDFAYTFASSTAKNKIKSVVLPKNITSLNQTFSSATALTKVVLPASLTSMVRSFYGCTSLATLVCPSATPPAAATLCFYRMGLNVPAENRTVYVPSEEAAEAYKEAAQWKYLVNGSGTTYVKYNFAVGTGE